MTLINSPETESTVLNGQGTTVDAAITDMKESLLLKYKNRLAFASERQCKKIEDGLHKLGQSLCTASL